MRKQNAVKLTHGKRHVCRKTCGSDLLRRKSAMQIRNASRHNVRARPSEQPRHGGNPGTGKSFPPLAINLRRRPQHVSLNQLQRWRNALGRVTGSPPARFFTSIPVGAHAQSARTLRWKCFRIIRRCLTESCKPTVSFTSSSCVDKDLAAFTLALWEWHPGRLNFAMMTERQCHRTKRYLIQPRNSSVVLHNSTGYSDSARFITMPSKKSHPRLRFSATFSTRRVSASVRWAFVRPFIELRPTAPARFEHLR